MDEKKQEVVVLSYGFRTFVLTKDEAEELSKDRDALRELVN